MKTRILLVALAALLLLMVGVYGYRRATVRPAQAAAEDCADKPKPQSEFAMAAECDGASEPAARPSPAPAK
jgi:cytochrome c-type biogenesis protein CcmH/NrfG